MNSGVPKPEKVLRAADENAPQDLNGIAASPNSYYQLLLKKCRSRRALLPASDRGQTNKGAQREAEQKAVKSKPKSR